MLAIFLIPAALCFAFGDAVSDRRQGHAILWAMSIIFVICVAVVMWAEWQGNPHFLTLGGDSAINMEGKRVASASLPVASLRSSPHQLPVAPLTPCMTPLPRWAGWCQCG
jgi:K+-transporting ATPase A subunit